MYASIRRYRVEPANVAKVKQLLQDWLVPAVTRVHGFVAYYLIDADDGVLTSVNIFEDRAGAEESNSLAADEREVIRNLLPKPPEVTVGEVAVRRVRS